MSLIKIKKLLLGLSLLVKNPRLINHVINDNESWKRIVLKNYSLGHTFPVISLTEIAKNNEENVNPYAFLSGNCLITDLILLKQLCRQFDDCQYFEIGTWRGESVANCSSVAKSCTTMNLPKHEILQQTGNSDYSDL